jgi:23S rRNA pseudouridine955/2504/2580 synthase
MKFVVSEHEHGMSLLTFLKEKCKGLSSIKKLKKAIDGKFCKVNGKVEFFSSHLLRTGDLIELDWHSFESKAHPQKMDILFEDADFAIVNKPAGIVSTDVSFQSLLKKNWKLAHRLDKDTSGLVLMTKTKRAEEPAKQLFSQKRIHKIYIALVDGIIKGKQGTIDNFLGKKGGYQGQTLYGKVDPSKGVRAVTRWKCIGQGKKSSVLLCDLITGRTHQIRVHLSEMGHPILGDHQYGHRFSCDVVLPRHLLHAWRLSFKHPFTEQEVRAEAPLPADFQEVLSSLKVNLDGAFDLVS